MRLTFFVNAVGGYLAAMLIASTRAYGAVELGGFPDPNAAKYSVVFDHYGITNPVVIFPNATPTGDLVVSFGTRFEGQVEGVPFNSLQVVTPSAPLALASGVVKTMIDVSAPTNLALGGVKPDSTFLTPLAVLFDGGVNFVSFDLGHLDATGDTRIEVYDAQGNRLGLFDRLAGGYNNFSLKETTGLNTIGGMSVYVPADHGMDWEGFGINNFVMTSDGDVIPEPTTLVVWSVLGSISLGAVWFKGRRRRTSIQ